MINYNLTFGQHRFCVHLRVIQNVHLILILKVALYRFFTALGIGMNGANALVFKRISILMMSLKARIFE